MIERSTVRCGGCECFQFRPENNLCRRCKKPLPEGSVTSTTIIFVPTPDPEPGDVVSMREVQQQAAVKAMAKIGATTHAAKALGITHARLKQLLRETGDDTNYRKAGAKRGTGRRDK